MLTFLPNIQVTVILIVLYSKILGTKKTLIIILIHVILDNLIMSSFNIMYVPFMYIGLTKCGLILSFVFKWMWVLKNDYLCTYFIILTESMRFIRKPGLVIALLFIYTTGMYLYFFPRNNEMSDTEKWTIVAVSYALLLLLWYLLRRKERLRREREEDME